MRTWRAGTVSMGVVLLITGLGLLYAQINEELVLHWAAKAWPLIFILLGAEVLWQARQASKNNTKVSYDILSVFVIMLLLGFGLTMEALRETGIVEQCKTSLASQHYDLIHAHDSIPIDTALKTIVIEQSDAPLEIISSPVNQITASCKADVTAPSLSRATQVLQQNQWLQTRTEGDTLYIAFASGQRVSPLAAGISIHGNTLYLPARLQVRIYSGVRDLRVHMDQIGNDWHIDGVDNAILNIPATSDVTLLAQAGAAGDLQGNAAWSVKESSAAANADTGAGTSGAEGRLTFGSGQHKISINSTGPVAVDVLPKLE